MASDPERMEEALAKQGVELFREVYRLMDDAEVEDYYKGNMWRDDLMRLDLQLIDAHRREGGAPDPMELDEVPSAETLMPKPAFSLQDPAKLALLAQLRGGGQGALGGGLHGMLAARIAALRDAANGGNASGGTGPAAELRLVALFVAKWKLDPTRTKAVLSELSAARRRYVIQKFQTDSIGIEATEHLETFVAECDLTDAWAGAEAAGAGTGPSGPSPMGGAAAQLAQALAKNALGQGLKRPLSLAPPGGASHFSDAAKRARLSQAWIAQGMQGGAGAGAAGSAQGLIRQRLAAVQAQAQQLQAAGAARGGATGLASALAARQQGFGAIGGAGVSRPGAAGGGTSQVAVALALRRQQLAAAAARPGGGQAGGPKSAAAGDLVRNLLTRF